MDEMHERSSGWSRLINSPILLGTLLALVGMNLSTAVPAWGIDSSFRVGLTEAVLDNLKFGIDVVWPYGPLGYLAGPTIIDRWMLAVAILYQFVALAMLFSMLVVHCTQLGLRRALTVVLLMPFALAISVTDNIVPEVVSVMLLFVLVMLWQQHRPGIPVPTTWWVLALSGFAAGAQVLVKFGPGMIACAVVVWFALYPAARLRLVPLAVAAITAGFFTFWFGTGQSAAALHPYIHTSLELSSGYQDAQAWAPSGGRMAVVGLMAAAAVAIGVFGAWRWSLNDRRNLLVLAPLALTLWFTLKQGFVRWDPWHAYGALLIVGPLVFSLRWEKRFLVLPVGVLICGSLTALAREPARLKSTWSDRMDAVLAVLSSNRQAQQLAESRARMRANYGVPTSVVNALNGGSVHAEAWDINAVWANDLSWKPLPNLQSYSTYTADLDHINAARYASVSGPDGVLLAPDSADNRYAIWESPDARVALTCNFIPVIESGAWTALRRGPNVCGSARELQTITVSQGDTITVPEPSRPDSLLVARFELPVNPLAKILTTIAKPPRYAGVMIDGNPHRLVTGTATNGHLLRSPGMIGTRHLPHGKLELSRLSFWNVGSGKIIVRFEEIPLAAP